MSALIIGTRADEERKSSAGVGGEREDGTVPDGAGNRAQGQGTQVASYS
jgi:hypothetical protein